MADKDTGAVWGRFTDWSPEREAEARKKRQARFCSVCGEVMPEGWEYAACKDCGKKGKCPHGGKLGDCDHCDFEADRAFDTAREDRAFGR